MSVKKITLYGLMIALAMLLSWVETLIPIQVAVPGMKIGLANLVVVTALYELGEKDAFIISTIRILLVAFTFTGFGPMMYSLAGGMLSCLVMILMKKMGIFSTTGVSVCGGVSHNIAQIVVAAFMLGTSRLVYYLPFLLVSGVVSGVVIGLLGAEIARRVHPVFRRV